MTTCRKKSISNCKDMKIKINILLVVIVALIVFYIFSGNISKYTTYDILNPIISDEDNRPSGPGSRVERSDTSSYFRPSGPGLRVERSDTSSSYVKGFRS